MKFEIDKKFIDDAVQSAVDEIKENYIPLSVIEDIKAEIEAYINAPNLSNKDGVEDGLRLAINLIDKHISGKEKE